MSENRFLKQAKEELAYLSGDPDFQRLVEARAGMLMDIYSFRKQDEEKVRAEGIATGITKGEKNKQIEIAKKLLELEIPIEKIITATGLSQEEIEKL